MFPIFLALLLSGVVECGRRPTDPNTLTALAAAEQRRQQLHSTREDRQARARERTHAQHLAQHLEQQSQPGNATQQAQEAAAQSEVVALNQTSLWSSGVQRSSSEGLQPP